MQQKGQVSDMKGITKYYRVRDYDLIGKKENNIYYLFPEV